MSTETIGAANKMSRKEARKKIYEKLETALQEFKTGIKEKRFASNLKKTSRLFANDLAKGMKQKKEKGKKKKEKMKKEVLNATNGTV